MNNWAKTLLDTIFSSSFIFGGLTFFAALVLMLACGGPMIAWLRNKRWRKQGESWTVREDTPDTHQAKQGTPSMGGIGIIGATTMAFIAVISIGFGLIGLAGRGSWPPPGGWGALIAILITLPTVFVAHGLLGFADDWSKASGRGGLRARAKLFFQFGLAVAFISAGLEFAVSGSGSTPMIELAPMRQAPLLFTLSLVFLVIFIVGTCNAVNLTDGLDGLAAGLAVATCGALILSVPDIDGADTAMTSILFCFALMGACLGFLKFNKYKAQVFMGDTGSLAIGAGLAAAAILLHAVWLLPFVGFMFYVEAASVTIQVLWFKWTKRKTG
ncbi:MAG: phospho-N-acetylmuramoyl-pentapeptide-transferase, partial [Abditibacteriota bacterium]|nr:phospho-N-acetylmuramoyl-pentapeptide-transferase [Abditibacteriota bacterium]